MDALEPVVRFHVYAALAAGSRAPGAEELAVTLAVPSSEVRAALLQLHAAHALVLDEATGAVRMALPFSNVPTAYQVESSGRCFWVNCAWDAVALVRLMALDEATIVDAGGQGRAARRLAVRGGALVERDGVVSIPVPARRWWEDIVFT